MLATDEPPPEQAPPSQDAPQHDIDLDSDELNDDADLQRPRLSIPIDEEEEDSFQAPPRLSAIDDDTYQSVEGPRRALTDQSLTRFSRSARVSDRFADLEALGVDDDGDALMNEEAPMPGDGEDDVWQHDSGNEM